MTKQNPKQVVYITTTEAAKRHGICSQRIRALIAQDRIPGVKRHGPAWMVPDPFTIEPSKVRRRALAKLKKS
jgi:hypothetical protein